MSLQKQKQGNRWRFTHAITMLSICCMVCIANNSNKNNVFPTAAAFASNTNRARNNNQFLPNRSSSLFSLEPTALKSTRMVPIQNVMNGASSPETSDGKSIPSGGDSVLDKVRMVSNFASFLCVLDCTLLPLVTVGLPLLGVLNIGADQLETFDKLGHSLALFFVLPVGSLTTTINYLSHKKKAISGLAVLGLTMVGLANSHIHVHNWPQIGPISLDGIGTILHKIQGCGTSPWHRIVNVSGCAFLLGSNYWSQQQDGCAAHRIAASGTTDTCCGHDH